MTQSIPTSGARRSRRPAGRSVRVLFAIAAAIVVVVAGFATYTLLRSSPSGDRLVIYTYPSLFQSGCARGPALDAVLAPFESAHHVQIELVCPSGSTLVSTLDAQRSNPQADLALGLDEITTPEAEAKGLLVPYVSPELTSVDPNVTRELSVDGGATPYEWGYLGIDYNTSFNAATHGTVAASAFPTFASNATLAHDLIVEDPTVDITGEEFLLWEIEFYETVLHQNWTTWWQTVGPHLQFAPDWGTAFNQFSGGPGSPPLVVSYTSDPAYAAASNQSGQLNSTVSIWNGTEYGWRTVYGVGIVAGSHQISLDQEFIDWFLGPTVQSAIALNEWEYPADRSIPLPAVFAANPDPGHIVPLDDRTTPAAIAANLTGPYGYLNTWQGIVSVPG